MNKKLSFSCPSLQKINDEADSIIANHLQYLDRTSNDIKALEERLKDAALPFLYIYVLSSETIYYNEREYDIFDYPNEIEYIDILDSCIVWDKTENGFRLTHTIFKTTSRAELQLYKLGFRKYEKVSEGKTSVVSKIPLIETKSHFRVEVEKELPEIFKNVIMALKSNSNLDKIVNYSSKYKNWLEKQSEDEVDNLPF